MHTPLGALQALNLHLRPPVSDSGSVVSGYFTTPKVRLREVRRYVPELAAGLPTLIVGDLNENSGGRAVKFLRARGFRSALPEFHPGARTWRWQTSVGRITHQLDHILYDRRLEPLDARVLRAGRSDHLPVLAIFQLVKRLRAPLQNAPVAGHRTAGRFLCLRKLALPPVGLVSSATNSARQLSTQLGPPFVGVLLNDRHWG